MKKVYKLQDLDCANCAAKMERAIAALPEVAAVTVSFMTQKMTIDWQGEEDLKKVIQLIKKVEPDCEVLTK